MLRPYFCSAGGRTLDKTRCSSSLIYGALVPVISGNSLPLNSPFWCSPHCPASSLSYDLAVRPSKYPDFLPFFSVTQCPPMPPGQEPHGRFVFRCFFPFCLLPILWQPGVSTFFMFHSSNGFLILFDPVFFPRPFFFLPIRNAACPSILFDLYPLRV